MAAIRSFPNDVAAYPQGARSDTWGRALKDLFDTGPSVMLSIGSRVEEQLDWLQRRQPDYLLIYPSALRDLLRLCREKGISFPKLREVRTLSEALTAETRELCREVWGLKVVDMYSTQEAGYLALQCPDHEHYHVQSEAALLEVINGVGQPCAPGEVGEVVVTPLTNFAMPMIRYAVGDLAEVGEACPCGRGLPVLKRILGRNRDMLVYPDGRKAWALIGDVYYTQFPEIRQFQVVQHAVDDLELKIVADRRLTGIEEAKLIEWVRYRSQHDFPIRVTYHDEIPRGPGGKFNDFRCDIPDSEVRALRESKA
jgi:phenylacetate-CoA ligase